MLAPDLRLAGSCGRPLAGTWTPWDFSTVQTLATYGEATTFVPGSTADSWTNSHFRTNGKVVSNGSSFYIAASPFQSYPFETVEWDVTITTAGATWSVGLQFLSGNPTPRYNLFVNGRPVSLTDITPAASANRFPYLTFAATGTYRVTLVTCGNSICYGTYGTTGQVVSAAPTYTKPKIAYFGDSWSEKYSGGTNALDKTQMRTTAFQWWLRGGQTCDVIEMGQASTGLFSNVGTGGRTLYNNTVRYQYLIDLGVQLAVVQGSVNDDGQTAAAQGTAMTAFLSQLATSLPNMAVVAMGVQPVTAGTTNRTDRNTAIIHAAKAAPNVVKIVDWYGERLAGSTDWLTGTGYRTAPTGSGNQDLYVTSDDLHLMPDGHVYIGNRIGDRIAFARSSLAA